MGLTVECPYCDHEQEEEWEDIPKEEDDQEETTCHKCDKVFLYSHDVIHTSHSEKTPCLNGEADHDWKRVHSTSMVIKGKMEQYCATCPERRRVPADQYAWDGVRDDYDREFAGPRPAEFGPYTIPKSLLKEAKP